MDGADVSGVLLDKVFGCALWQGKLDKDGYGFHGRTRAHTKAWADERGPVPEGLVLDHLCRRRNCCALHHLEAVTRSENEKRKSFKYRLARKRCAKGHDLNVTRALTDEGGVTCRTCNREALERSNGV